MIIKKTFFEQYSDFEFRIPLTGKEKLHVNKGDLIKEGDMIYTKSKPLIRASFFLPKELGCKLEDCSDYIKCVDGQYVEVGEVLAQMPSSGGLSVKQIVAPQEGVVELDGLSVGKIEILGESSEYILESKFKGEVLNANPSDGIVVKSNALATDILFASNKLRESEWLGGNSYFGEFFLLGDGLELSIEEIKQADYRGKIVMVPNELTENLLANIFERGALCVIFYTADYLGLRDIPWPVGVVGGFGKGSFDERIRKEFVQLNGNFVVVDPMEMQMFFTSSQTLHQKPNIFVEDLAGSTVISKSPQRYGFIGRVENVEDDGFVTVSYGNRGIAVEDVGNVDFLSL